MADGRHIANRWI